MRVIKSQDILQQKMIDFFKGFEFIDAYIENILTLKKAIIYITYKH